MKSAAEIVKESMDKVSGYMPWDLKDLMEEGKVHMIIDVREPEEYNAMHIEGSRLVPRGIIEGACEWGSRNTIPELAASRDKKVILVCLGGERSAMAADVMMDMGYTDVHNLKTGLRGWNDSDYPLVDSEGNAVDPDHADEVFNRPATPEQMGPKAVKS